MKKVTDKELKELQGLVSNVNRAQAQIGGIETQKHTLLHYIAGLNDELKLMQEEFVNTYGSDDINIMDGTITEKSDGESN